jgi:hypothetical protein
LKKIYVAAHALGLNAPEGESLKRFNTDTGFRAALLKAQFGLPLDACPKLEQALDALSWTLAGFPPQGRFNVKAVQTALIQRALGEPAAIGSKPDPKKEATRLLAKQIGARQSGRDELRTAAICHWVDRGSAPRAPGGASPPPAPPKPAPMAAPPDLTAFARLALEAARGCQTGRFGDNKVFISHVWRTLGEQPVFHGVDLEYFKLRLAEANHARLLDLSRADLVEAMDPEDVRQSETTHQGATFHFIRI